MSDAGSTEGRGRAHQAECVSRCPCHSRLSDETFAARAGVSARRRQIIELHLSARENSVELNTVKERGSFLSEQSPGKLVMASKQKDTVRDTQGQRDV